MVSIHINHDERSTNDNNKNFRKSDNDSGQEEYEHLLQDNEQLLRDILKLKDRLYLTINTDYDYNAFRSEKDV